MMTEIPLTPRLDAKLGGLFAIDDRPLAKEWLLSECGPHISGGYSDLVWVERVRAAALKVSNGSLDKLGRATELLKKDWRDLVMVADFGSLDAHEAWLNEPVP